MEFGRSSTYILYDVALGTELQFKVKLVLSELIDKVVFVFECSKDCKVAPGDKSGRSLKTVIFPLRKALSGKQ